MNTNSSLSFNPETQSDILHQAILNKSTNTPLINLITSISNSQRQLVKQYYNTIYTSSSLEKSLSKKLSSHVKDFVLALFQTPTSYDTEQIFKAIDGAGTDEDTLTEIIATRSIHQINSIASEYQKLHNETLKEAIEGDTSGIYLQLLIALISGGRSDNPYPCEKECNEICEKLYKNGEGGKKDEDYFVKIFANRSPAELAMIGRLYEKKYKNNLEEVIKKLFSGDERLLFRTVLEGIINPGRYFAKRIREAVDRTFVKDKILIRVMVSRSEVDIEMIKKWYLKLYKEELIDVFKKKFDGDYRELLIAMCGR